MFTERENTKFDMKAQRFELNLTMAEVANAVGVSEATISRWESGAIENMGRDKIARLAKVLQVSPDTILGINDKASDDLAKKEIENLIKERNTLKAQNEALNKAIRKYLDLDQTNRLITLSHPIGEIVYYAPKNCRTSENIQRFRILLISVYGGNSYRYVLERIGRVGEQRTFYENDFGEELFTEYKDAVAAIRRRVADTTMISVQTGDLIMCDGKLICDVGLMVAVFMAFPLTIVMAFLLLPFIITLGKIRTKFLDANTGYIFVIIMFINICLGVAYAFFFKNDAINCVGICMIIAFILSIIKRVFFLDTKEDLNIPDDNYSVYVLFIGASISVFLTCIVSAKIKLLMPYSPISLLESINAIVFGFLVSVILSGTLTIRAIKKRNLITSSEKMLDVQENKVSKNTEIEQKS